MRLRTVLLLSAGLVMISGGLTAQDAPVDANAPPTTTAEIRSNPTDLNKLPIRTQSERHAMLLKSVNLVDADIREVAGLLAKVIRAADYRCDWVSDYQIVRFDAEFRSFKAKCPGEPIYGIEVGDDGSLTVLGGEFMVAGLGPGDGDIISFTFSPAGSPAGGTLPGGNAVTSSQAAQDGSTAPTAEANSRPRVRSSMRPADWVLTSLVVNGIAAGLLVAFTVMVFRRSSHQHAEMAQRLTRMTSVEKDAMIEQADPVGPDIYRHEGIYIARGRRGRRRFFSRKLGAVLYRDTGFRLFEVH